jgi:uncharacterized membrane protein
VDAAHTNPNLTVWTFPAAEAARRALDILRSLQHKARITIHDAAVIEWPHDRREPETREFHHIEAGGGRSRIWSGLFGALFSVEGVISRRFRDLGVDDRLLAEMRARIQPETSLLLVLTTGGFVRDLEPSFVEFDMTLVYTTFPETSHRRLARLGSLAHPDL